MTPTYRIPAKARALLLDRDMPLQRLADVSAVQHRRVMRALSSHPQARPEDARQLVPFLRPDELRSLGWFEAGGLLAVEQTEQFPVEQFKKAS